ncbi:radical SAM superfamily protein [Oxobacter pfennigii]|uniref:Radical SAM superfamily protein n=1 Tax=Oxobacter pfennigii TaxID=36849 RepID=A0A0P8W5E7_9CLOT|nr:radical SAM protein [Oxobacter pfennigii]KPU42843.1 radical SAM superfamily protein [Oxobacter pfennigii]
MEIPELLSQCKLCPRKCNTDRLKGNLGYCRAGADIKAAKAMLHKWEEPIISGGNGSGAVFFSGCNLSCVFCQNFDISQQDKGKIITSEQLADIFLKLQSQGADNINLVSPVQYMPQIVKSLELSKSNGLLIPVIYNSNGYENKDMLKYLDGLVDVYLPDIKYYSDKYAIKYSNAPNYFHHASQGLLEMYRQVGSPEFSGDLIKRGLMIRHLLLPGQLSESRIILDWIADNLPHDIYISLMCQYVPMHRAGEFPEINKKVSQKSYDWLVDYCLSLGLVNGFIQDMDSADNIYTPEFDFEGI